jgi:hypothetical protein
MMNTVQSVLPTALTRPFRLLLIRGVHVVDKHRHSYRPAPKGFLPNWVLVVLAACAVAISGLAHSIF